MKVKRIAECYKMEHSAILLIFNKRRSVFKTLGLSVCESPLKSGFTVFIVLRKRDCVDTFNCIITYLLPQIGLQIIAYCRSKVLQNAPRGAFCNNFDRHLATCTICH